MTPTTYWIGWAIVLAVVIAAVVGLGWYLGAKLDTLAELIRGR